MPGRPAYSRWMAGARPVPGTPTPTGRLTAARVQAAVAVASGERTRRHALVDAALVLASLAYLPWSVGMDQSVWALLPHWWLPLDVSIGVAASLSLWWRRRYPAVIAAALALLGGVFVGAGIPALIAVYTVASLRNLWIALAATLGHLALAIPYYLFVPIGGIGLEAWTVTIVAMYTTALALGLAVRARRQVISGLVASAAAERRDQEARFERARELERARIAREMHDVLAHRLSILSVHAGALERRAGEGPSRPLDPAELREAAGVIRSSAHVALEELRDVLAVLGSTGADELGTATPQPTFTDLERLLAEARAAGERVRFECADDPRLTTARPQLQRTVYRVVQEGLTNARKHAPGATVEVRIQATRAGVRVSVRNALPVGVAPAEVPGSGLGLTGLAERVRLDGGTLTAGPREGSFVLVAELPWRE